MGAVSGATAEMEITARRMAMENGVLDKVADAAIVGGVATYAGLSLTEVTGVMQVVFLGVSIFAVAGAGWYHWTRAWIIRRKQNEETEPEDQP